MGGLLKGRSQGNEKVRTRREVVFDFFNSMLPLRGRKRRYWAGRGGGTEVVVRCSVKGERGLRKGCGLKIERIFLQIKQYLVFWRLKPLRESKAIHTESPKGKDASYFHCAKRRTSTAYGSPLWARRKGGGEEGRITCRSRKRYYGHLFKCGRNQTKPTEPSEKFWAWCEFIGGNGVGGFPY